MVQFLILNEENLRNAYCKDELTQRECGNLFNRSQRSIINYMRKYGIEARARFNKKHRNRISKKLKNNKNGSGVVFSESRRRKIRDSVKQSWIDNPNQGMVGKKHSEATKSKISYSHLKENLSDDALQAYRESAIIRIERQIANGLPMTPSIGLCETEIIDKYEQLLNCKFERQYRIAGFFVDGYCKEKNIVIEVDEYYHKNREKQDIYRDEIIRRELNCDIIRIKV